MKKDPLESLRLADEALKRAVEEKQRAKLEADRKSIMDGVARELPQMLEPLLAQVAESSRLNSDEVIAAIKGISIEQPNVSVNVDVPKAEVSVKSDPIVVPPIDTQPLVDAIRQGISGIKIPRPEVTVNAPKQEFPKMPDFPAFPTDIGLRGVDKKSPLPVMMMGADGKPAQFPVSMGSGGGRADFLTIKDIQASAGGSLIDADGFLKVTGSFVTAASNASTQAIDSSGDVYSVLNPFPVQVVSGASATSATNIVDSSGVAYSGSNPVPVTFTGSASSNVSIVNSDGSYYNSDNPLPVTFSAASVQPVSQVSGAAWSVSVTDVVATVGVVTINPDGNPVYGGTSSGGTVQVQDSYGSSITSFGSGDSKGLAVAIVDASGNQITSFGGGTQYADGATGSIPTGTVAFGDTGEESGNLFALATFSGVVSSGTLRTVQAVDSVSSVNVVSTVGLTDTQLRASSVDVKQVSGSSDSVNVLNTVTVSATALDTRALDFTTDDISVYQVSGHRWSTEATQSGTWNIGTVTAVTSITNSVAANIVDSSGVAYSGSNPVPISDAGGVITVDGTVTVSDITASVKSALIDSSGVQYSGSNPVPITGNIGTVTTVTGVTNSVAVVALDRDGNPLTTGPIAQGDAATALRVIIAGNSDASVVVNSGTITTVTTLTGVTNSVAVVSLDRDGNPLTTGPIGLGDAATALRVVVAGNSDASVTATQTGTWNINAVTSITNSIAAAVVDSTGVAYGSANPLHIAVHDSTGSTISSFPSGDIKGLAVAIVDGAGAQITSFGGGTQYADGGTASTPTGTVAMGETGEESGNVYALATFSGVVSSGTLRVVHAVDAVASVNLATALSSTIDSITAVGDIANDGADSGNPVKIGGVARTSNPTAVANADRVNASFDDVGRQMIRPVQARDLLTTAYATLSTNTETTLASAGGTGVFLDLIWVKFSNTSSGAVTVDLRDVTAGNIVDTWEVGANASLGISMPVPYPQGNANNNWTVDYNDSDLSNTTVYVSALFSKEV